jgi:hypothetical protein
MLYLLLAFFILISVYNPAQTQCKAAVITTPSDKNYLHESEWFENNKAIIANSISNYLSTLSLEPILEVGKYDYQLISLENILAKETNLKGSFSTAILIAEFTQKDKTFKAAFKIIRNIKNNNIDVKLLYISNTTISSILFFDILSLAINQVKAYSLENSLIFIDNVHDNVEGERSQKWTFFNENNKEDLIVVLTPDGKGGTFFKLGKPIA